MSSKSMVVESSRAWVGWSENYGRYFLDYRQLDAPDQSVCFENKEDLLAAHKLLTDFILQEFLNHKE